MVPTEYCTYHGGVQDENGNWVLPEEDDEINSINIKSNINNNSTSGNNYTNSSETAFSSKSNNSNSEVSSDSSNESSNAYLDVNGVPDWINNTKR